VSSGDLRAILRIKHMATEAGREPERGYAPPSASYEMAAAYIRLREEARLLNERAGWSAEEFDRDVPEPDFGDLPRPDDESDRASYELVSVAGPRARLLLRLLAAWAAGHAVAFEIEARLKADAEARRGEGGPRQTGFR
jgi:hypothetical protein